MKAINLKKDLKKQRNYQEAENRQKFFKTKKGEYGYGDVFLGLKVPEQRKIAKKYTSLPLNEVSKLIKDKIHECRFCALIILIDKYRKGNNKNKKEIVDFYLNNTKNINNWDLVDISAPAILGDFFLNKNRSIIKKLAISNNLWEKRMAIVCTINFIKNNDINFTLKLSKELLKDNQDLIHKAIGWMLREVGKKDINALTSFIELNINDIPRVTLRYSIEKLKESQRKLILKK